MKKFLIKLSYTVLPVWAVLVATVLYISLYVSPRMSGDIGRLACIPFGFEYNEMLDQSALKDTFFLTINHPAELKRIHTTVLTIGDSFSQMGRIGYQNYMGQQGIDVVNKHLEPHNNPLQEAYNILDRGLIDSSTVKVLIVENVERDFELNVQSFRISNVVVDEPEKEPAEEEDESDETTGTGSSSNWSVERARNLILFKTGYKSPVFTATLRSDLFTCDEPRTLYFYHDDIDQGFNISPTTDDKVRLVWQSLLQKATERGIHLILLIAVDKYDAYQSMIVDNPFPHKTFCEDIERIIGPDFHLLMSKRSLLPLIESGEKDVFMFNDSHWSYKASSIIARELIDRVHKAK
ncbi:MAG: hypothetical protein IKD75_06965 [Prevotella sp.]|nr:hypothetical protein [Prevotella sp.]